MKQIPAMLYNSKKQKQNFGLLEQIKSRNSQLSFSKTTNFLAGKFNILIIQTLKMRI